MKADVEKKIPARIAAAFADLAAGASNEGRNRILMLAEEFVKAVWVAKIYRSLPRAETKIENYFLDQELERFLDEAVEESHERLAAIAAAVRGNWNG